MFIQLILKPIQAGKIFHQSLSFVKKLKIAAENKFWNACKEKLQVGFFKFWLRNSDYMLCVRASCFTKFPSFFQIFNCFFLSRSRPYHPLCFETPTSFRVERSDAKPWSLHRSFLKRYIVKFAIDQ